MRRAEGKGKGIVRYADEDEDDKEETVDEEEEESWESIMPTNTNVSSPKTVKGETTVSHGAPPKSSSQAAHIAPPVGAAASTSTGSKSSAKKEAQSKGPLKAPKGANLATSFVVKSADSTSAGPASSGSASKQPQSSSSNVDVTSKSAVKGSKHSTGPLPPPKGANKAQGFNMKPATVPATTKSANSTGSNTQSLGAGSSTNTAASQASASMPTAIGNVNSTGPSTSTSTCPPLPGLGQGVKHSRWATLPGANVPNTAALAPYGSLTTLQATKAPASVAPAAPAVSENDVDMERASEVPEDQPLPGNDNMTGIETQEVADHEDEDEGISSTETSVYLDVLPDASSEM